MDQVIPWKRICQILERHYPTGEGPGRPPVGVERTLRIYFLQHWFNLSDPAVEEALYDSNAMRAFVAIDLGRERFPDETTVCKFRHLLERSGTVWGSGSSRRSMPTWLPVECMDTVQ
jgi:IS5 family transposase